MISATTLTQANKIVESSKVAALQEMPNATFVFKGLDSENIYFDVVCKLSKTNESEIKDLSEKTWFNPVSESSISIYKGEFSASIC